MAEFLAPSHLSPLLLTGTVIGYALLMLANPVRSSLRDGLRCLRRYPQLWTLPALFGGVSALFGFWVRVLADPSALLAAPAGLHLPDWPAAVSGALLPALEGTAGIFNIAVAMFPLSALGALLFLLNWGGYQTELARALFRRLGGLRGLLAYVTTFLCALAAFFKPAIFLFGRERIVGALPGSVPGALTLALPWLLAAVDALGFVFDCLLGIGLQIYLILLAYAWVRGLGFEHSELRHFAVRRFAFVAKWAAVVLAFSALGIQLPLFLLAADVPIPVEVALRWAQIGRWILCALLLAGAALQITLVFHNESLRRALRDHARLVRHHGAHLFWLIAVAALHFLLLTTLDAALVNALGGPQTLPATGLALIFPFAWAALGGWLLASWVCLYRRFASNRPEADEMVKF